MSLPPAPFFSWHDLVLGRHAKPLNIPFHGKINSPGIYSVVGTNGCGKSTLLKTWLGLLNPLSGGVNAPWLPLVPGHIQERCGYVPQAHTVNPYCRVSVHDFVAQGLGPRPHSHEQGLCHVFPLLEQWELAAFSETSFHDLSGGQKTRALLARAFIAKPHVLFLDEPLASLDTCCQWQLMQTLEVLVRSENRLVVIIDHHLDPFAAFIKGQIRFRKQHDAEKSEIVLNVNGKMD